MGLFLGAFIQSRKCVSLKFIGDLCVMRMKNDAKFEEELTWVIWWILGQALKNLKNLNFNELLLTKVYNVWAKKGTEELSLIALKIDVKFEDKLTCTF